jgi:hypothetical protein
MHALEKSNAVRAITIITHRHGAGLGLGVIIGLFWVSFLSGRGWVGLDWISVVSLISPLRLRCCFFPIRHHLIFCFICFSASFRAREGENMGLRGWMDGWTQLHWSRRFLHKIFPDSPQTCFFVCLFFFSLFFAIPFFGELFFFCGLLFAKVGT